jgi:hypothetical protein
MVRKPGIYPVGIGSTFNVGSFGMRVHVVFRGVFCSAMLFAFEYMLFTAAS